MKGKIFNAQEVQAILNGSKVMFREVIKHDFHPSFPNEYHPAVVGYRQESNGKWYAEVREKGVQQQYLSTFPLNGIECPYQVGQKIFVKEAFWQFGGYDSGYDCDKPRFIGSSKITFSEEEAAKPQTLCKGWKKRPAQHMKQEHSRLTLKIKSVKVERLQDISEEDCLAEGLEYDWLGGKGNILVAGSIRENFAKLWNSTHKKPEEKWEASPWVWCFEYEVVR